MNTPGEELRAANGPTGDDTPAGSETDVSRVSRQRPVRVVGEVAGLAAPMFDAPSTYGPIRSSTV